MYCKRVNKDVTAMCVVTVKVLTICHRVLRDWGIEFGLAT